MKSTSRLLPLLMAVLIPVVGSGFTQDAMAESVTSGDDIRIENKTMGNLSSGKSIFLSGATVTGNTTAGREVTSTRSDFSGGISAGRSITLEDGEVTGNLSAGQNVILKDVTVNGQIKAGRLVNMENVTASGNVMSARPPVVRHSTVSGTLHTVGESVSIENSTVGAIKISTASALGFKTGGLYLHGGSIVSGAGGHPVISVGEGGMANINGYTIRAMNQKTVVIVPDGSVYENGEKKSGEAEQRYGDYQKTHAGAPEVHGPGWSGDSETKKSNDATDATVVLTLIGNSQVKGDVIFENAKGKVFLSPDSHVAGEVINGVLERLPR